MAGEPFWMLYRNENMSTPRDLPPGAKNPPSRRIWRLLRSISRDGGIPLPDFTKRNFNRILKFTLTKLKFPDARKYTSKAFRMGGTQDLLMKGTPLGVIKGPGGCRLIGF